MVSTEKGFHEIANLYNQLFAKFFELHKIKKVVCTDKEECFFDCIEVNDDGTMNVYKYGLSSPFANLSFDFTMDYAKCLSNMEHDLYMQERRGSHNKFTFYFTDIYEEPTLISRDEIDELENQGEQKLGDNIKLKFREGEWVVNKLGELWHIDSFDKKNYQVSDGKGNYNYFPISKQNEMHIWTMADAKIFKKD